MSVRDASPADIPHVFILASAGTGKTFRLTNRYLELLVRGEDPSAIVATTFTRKAAGEIFERVAGRLGEAASDASKLDALRRFVGEGLTRSRSAALLRRVALDRRRVSVLTLDAWMSAIAAGMSLELGVAPGWRMSEEDEDRALRRRAVGAALDTMDAGDVGELLRMNSRGQPPSETYEAVLKTVGETYDAYLASGGSREFWVCEAHAGRELDALSLADAIRGLEHLPEGALPISGKGAKAKPNGHYEKAVRSVIANSLGERWEWLVTKGLTGICMDAEPVYYSKAVPELLLERLRPLREHAAAVVAHLHAHATGAAFDLVRAFDRAYMAMKLGSGRLRFNDVPRLLLSADLRDLHELYYRLDAQIRHVLLDEFQDTSVDQFALLRPVLDELLSQARDARSVLAVGDVKQSLYGWRGAEPELLSRLPERYSAARLERMNESFRSSPVVLDTVNRVFGGIGEHAALRDDGPWATGARAFAQGFSEHSAHRRELAGYAALICVPGDDGSDDDEPDTESAEDASWLRARFIARRAAALSELAPNGTIGVLTRTNKPIPDIVRALAQLGVQARGERGNPLTDAAPVNVALSALLLGERPGDELAAYHVAMSPMGPALGLRGVVSEDDRRRASALIRQHVARDGLGATLRTLGLSARGAMTARELARYAQLLELCDEWAARDGTPGDASAFVDWVRETAIDDAHGVGARARVSVMTVHQAKGLEFDAVVLAELDRAWRLQPGTVLGERDTPDGPLARVALYANEAERASSPILQQLHNAATARLVREELSGLYVGLTRARHAVEMIVAELRETKDGPGVIDASKQPSAARVLRGALLDEPGENEGLPIDGSGARVLWATGSTAWGAQANGAHTEDDDRPETPVREVVIRAPERVRTRAVVVHPSQEHDELGGDTAIAPIGGVFDRARGAAAEDASGEGLGRAIGTLVHAWLGLIEWGEDWGGIGADEKAAAALAAGIHGIDGAWSGAERVLESAMTSPEIREALSRERYRAWHESGLGVQVRREWALAAWVERKQGPRVVRGRIDRVVLGRDASGRVVRAEVLDFKTDAVNNPAAIEAATARHAGQMRAYASAVASAFGLGTDRVGLTLIFTSPGRTRAVEAG